MSEPKPPPYIAPEGIDDGWNTRGVRIPVEDERPDQVAEAVSAGRAQRNASMVDALTRAVKYRFIRTAFRRSVCMVCHCLVDFGSMKSHAKWHYASGDRPDELRYTVRSFCDVTVVPDGQAFKSKWLSTGVGPK